MTLRDQLVRFVEELSNLAQQAEEEKKFRLFVAARAAAAILDDIRIQNDDIIKNADVVQNED